MKKKIMVIDNVEGFMIGGEENEEEKMKVGLIYIGNKGDLGWK